MMSLLLVISTLPTSLGLRHRLMGIRLQPLEREDWNHLTWEYGFSTLPWAAALEHIRWTHTWFKTPPESIRRDLWLTDVLNPWADDPRSPKDWRLRRQLLEYLAPRVPQASSPIDRASRVAQCTREMVGMSDHAVIWKGGMEAWKMAWTDEAGWERLYIAGLRSVSLPARLGADGRATLWAMGQWMDAPRPFLEHISETQVPLPAREPGVENPGKDSRLLER